MLRSTRTAMGSRLPHLIDEPGRWRIVDAGAWERLRPVLLGTDQPSARQVGKILVGGEYQPDSFTIAERMSGPGWLDEQERDGDAWLEALVRRRLPAAVPTGHGRSDPGAHVAGELRRVLEYRADGHLVAETLWNQEAPYLVDRLIGWCLYGDIAISAHVSGGFSRHGRAFTGRFLTRFASSLGRLDTAALARVAVAAGLLGLDRKGGPMRCTPIPLPDPGAGTGYDRAWQRLHDVASRKPAVDHLDRLLDRVGTGTARLVWWLDDLIETAFDLLLIQRLVAVNPRLRVVVVPKRGRHDNDACTADVAWMLRTGPLAGLRDAVGTGRVDVSRHGPRMATANPTKLHPTLIDAVAACDVMVCKGGRVHEMFNGNVTAAMFTAYVVVRSFTETQAGVDSTHAPLMIFGAGSGEWPWWGFQARATRNLTLPSGRTISACQTTVAEHTSRVGQRDPLTLAGDLACLVAAWPSVRLRYGRAARAEIQLVLDRLIPHVHGLPSSQRRIVHHASTIITTGAAVDADRDD
jgi:hypothetical protein